MQNRRIIVLVLTGVVVIVVAFFVTLAFSSTAATLVGATVVTLVTLISGALLVYRSREQVAFRRETFPSATAWSPPQQQKLHKSYQLSKTPTTPGNRQAVKRNQPVEAQEEEAERQMRLVQKYADDYRKKFCADPHMAK